MLNAYPASSFAWGRAPLLLFGALAAGCGGGGGSDTADWLFPLWTPTSVRVVDLDGNGLPDVVTTAVLSPRMGVFEGHVKVRLQTSPGVFATPQDHRTGLQAWTTQIADIDGDDRPDLVVGEPTNVWDEQVSPGGVWLLRQDGAQPGHFLSPTRLLSGPNVEDLDVADLTGDGVVDLALSDARTGANRVVILPQDPLNRGTFLAARDLNMPGPVTRVVARDLNADGQADLSTAFTSATRADHSYDTTLGLSLQDAGSFATAQWQTTFAYGPASHLTVTDFNLDGRPDVAAYFGRFDERAVPTIRLLLQNSSGEWDGAIDTALPVTTVPGRDGQAVADLNGDGRPDVAFVGTYPSGTTADGVSIIRSDLTLLLQSGDGHFVPTTVYTVPMQATRVGANDVNGDGRIDLVVYGSIPQSRSGNVDRALLLLQSSATPGQFLAPLTLP